MKTVKYNFTRKELSKRLYDIEKELSSTDLWALAPSSSLEKIEELRAKIDDIICDLLS